jgi:hypothetical protein
MVCVLYIGTQDATSETTKSSLLLILLMQVLGSYQHFDYQLTVLIIQKKELLRQKRINFFYYFFLKFECECSFYILSFQCHQAMDDGTNQQ